MTPSPAASLPPYRWQKSMAVFGGWVYDVDFPDARHGMAVGKDVYVTRDGGRSWILSGRGAGARLSLRRISAVDARRAFAVGDMLGVVYSTADGGTTWTQLQTRPRVYFADVAFADRLHGWAVGNDRSSHGVIAATSDGGRHWRVSRGRPGDLGYLNAVTCADASHVWAAGMGVLLATTDGGETWTRQREDAEEAFTGITFVDPRHGWAVGDRGSLLATRDGGKSWVEQNQAMDLSFSSVFFLDRCRGWVTALNQDQESADAGYVLATTDSGRTWSRDLRVSRGSQLDGVWFSRPSRGWASGSMEIGVDRYKGLILRAVPRQR